MVKSHIKIITCLIAGMMVADSVAGCKKEMTVNNSVNEHSWKMIPELSTDFMSGQMNSYSDSSGLYLFSPTLITTCRNSSDNTPMKVSRDGFTYSVLPMVRFPLCAKYFASTYNQNLRIGTTSSPSNPAGYKYLWMVLLDSSFSSFLYAPLITGNSVGINNKNSLLAVYSYSNLNSGGIAAILVNLNIFNTGAMDVLDTVSTSIIHLNQSTRFNAVYNFFDHYFVSTSTTIRIAPTGSFIICYPQPIYNMFQIGSNVYGMSFGKVVKSFDAGVSWTEIGEINSGLEFMTYVQADNNVFAFYENTILHVSGTDSALTVEEINNDGLAEKQITSLNRYRNEMFAVTLAGVYGQPINTFYTYKQSTKRNLLR